MDEVERIPVAERPQPISNFQFQLFSFLHLHRLPPGERKDRVVKIRLPRPVAGAAFRSELPRKERAHQVRGIAKMLRREPRDLEHFEAQAAASDRGGRRRGHGATVGVRLALTRKKARR